MIRRKSSLNDRRCAITHGKIRSPKEKRHAMRPPLRLRLSPGQEAALEEHYRRIPFRASGRAAGCSCCRTKGDASSDCHDRRGRPGDGPLDNSSVRARRAARSARSPAVRSPAQRHSRLGAVAAPPRRTRPADSSSRVIRAASEFGRPLQP